MFDLKNLNFALNFKIAEVFLRKVEIICPKENFLINKVRIGEVRIGFVYILSYDEIWR